MGPFLKQFASKAIREVSVSDYEGRKIAFDVSIFVNTYYYRNRAQEPNVVVKEFRKLVNNALDENIYPIFVMEGRKLKLKANEHKKRQADRERKEELLDECKKRRVRMEEEATEKGYVLGQHKMLPTGMIIPTSAARKLEVGTPEESMFIKQYMNVCDEYEKRIQMSGRPSKEHFDAVLSYLEGEEVGIEFAEDEAERHCSLLCKTGKVYAVATQDYDAVPFGAPKIVMNWDTRNMKEIDLAVALDELGWNMDQLIDFCILCGCDFSEKVPQIGPKKAYNLVCKHGCIENMWPRLKPNFYRHEGSEEAFRYKVARLVFNHQVEEAEDMIASPDSKLVVKRRRTEKFKEVELTYPDE